MLKRLAGALQGWIDLAENEVIEGVGDGCLVGVSGQPLEKRARSIGLSRLRKSTREQADHERGAG